MLLLNGIQNFFFYVSSIIILLFTGIISISFYYKYKKRKALIQKGLNKKKSNASKKENDLSLLYFNNIISKNQVKIIDFFQEKVKDSFVYIHNTSDIHTVNKILKNGFKFSEGLYKTSQKINNDMTELSYKLRQYREYGNYLIIICINKDLHNMVHNLLNTKKILQPIEFALCDYIPHEELCYLLPSMFVCGYINFNNFTIIQNDNYLKDYDFNVIKDKIIRKLDE